MKKNNLMPHSKISRINTWKKFAKKIRTQGCSLLQKLDNFPDAILISGCQRSGTTMLSRIITESEGMVNYWFGPDDELAAALILSNAVEISSNGRYCFQTTYLNECYHEYFSCIKSQRLIWVTRNPYSVIYSMLYNWKRFAFNELFLSCGYHLLSEQDADRFTRFGKLGISRIKRACLAYNGKTSQLFELIKELDHQNLFVVDYDDLIKYKSLILKKIYEFAELPYKDSYLEKIHSKSTNKYDLLSQKEKDTIKEVCLPIYEKAYSLSEQYTK